ncbi:glutaredoxin family protein [Microbulbifer sp. M83]|uniref:glutaredoxin family protein n=1 Tax=Microbulbifer sp. M83 TaxID=3118246 RepID=UPI002FDF740F
MSVPVRTMLVLLSLAGAAVADQAKAEQVLEVFVRDGCPHCAAAKEYLPQFAHEHPGLRIVYRSLDSDPRAAEDLARHSRRAGAWPPGVPTFVIEDRVLVGFASPGVTGPQLTELVKRGAATPGKTEAAGPGGLDVADLGLPLFTIALGLIDGFNPCAMWVLLVLLSILVRLQDRRRMALIAGTFVLVSGAVYYMFMAAWLNLFLLVGVSALLRWLLGGVALAIGALNLRDFFRSGDQCGRDYMLSIPESAKPGLYERLRRVLRADSLAASLVGVALLAILVNFIELLCTAGLPAIYTAVLSRQELGAGAYYAYLGLYILAYIADDLLMVSIAVIALGSRRLTDRAGRWLKFTSGLVMLVLGVILVLFPQLLV